MEVLSIVQLRDTATAGVDVDLSLPAVGAQGRSQLSRDGGSAQHVMQCRSREVEAVSGLTREVEEMEVCRDETKRGCRGRRATRNEFRDRCWEWRAKR